MCDVNRRYDQLRVADNILVKATRISEVAQIARAETLLRQYLYAQWLAYTKAATRNAVSDAKKLKKPADIIKMVDAKMKGWGPAVRKRLFKEIEFSYKKSKQAVYKKAETRSDASLGYNLPKFEVKKAVGVEFTLVDEETIRALKNHQLFWLEEIYDEGVSHEIATVVRQTMVEAGQNSSIAGSLMAERLKEQFGIIQTPGGFVGTSAQYFEASAANAVTTARAFAQIRSFDEIGVTRYTISNPEDHRTCERCSHIAGKVFTVKQGVNQIQSDMAAKTPEALKKSHPWLSYKELLKISPVPGRLTGKEGVKDSMALSDAGLSLPTYHFKCRCVADIDSSIVSYDDLVF